jgi:hypothetical protein
LVSGPTGPTISTIAGKLELIAGRELGQLNILRPNTKKDRTVKSASEPSRSRLSVPLMKFIARTSEKPGHEKIGRLLVKYDPRS